MGSKNHFCWLEALFDDLTFAGEKTHQIAGYFLEYSEFPKSHKTLHWFLGASYTKALQLVVVGNVIETLQLFSEVFVESNMLLQVFGIMFPNTYCIKYAALEVFGLYADFILNSNTDMLLGSHLIFRFHILLVF